ncbi:hypothetical protein MPL3365_170186 [Mesorhizobium plurifarium]|uniref:Uncharacterized protein n=1 Tax=Mesorhizobium plurifarium TaxID=69974 RepID=A0A090GTE8_MESPL|nr:hypothetical protein MPL3365_170186 [Mesorhizobium plurifarium]
MRSLHEAAARRVRPLEGVAGHHYGLWVKNITCTRDRSTENAGHIRKDMVAAYVPPPFARAMKLSILNPRHKLDVKDARRFAWRTG